MAKHTKHRFDPKNLIPVSEGVFKESYVTSNGTQVTRYFKSCHCTVCGGTFYQPTTSKGQKVLCQSQMCKKIRKEEEREGEERIIIPKVISSDIGGYLMFGRMIYSDPYPTGYNSSFDGVRISRQDNGRKATI